MNNFEKLIEYVINDEDEKAKELFHQIVVEKSRQIYEDLMQEEAEEDLDEAKEEEEGEEDLDEAKEEEEGEQLDESPDEEMDETMGGSASHKLIKDVKAKVEGDESGMTEDDEEGEEEGEEDEGGDEMSDMDMGDAAEEAELEDRVVDLEDKLDELMAEFEAMMGDQEPDMGDVEDMDDMNPDAMAMDDTADMGDEDEMDEMGMMEAVSLKKAPSAKTNEEGGIQTKSPVAANAGAQSPIGSKVKPVHTATTEEKGRSAPTAKEVGVTPTQEAGAKAFKSAAPKPVTSQASGVNTKSPVKGH